MLLITRLGAPCNERLQTLHDEQSITKCHPSCSDPQCNLVGSDSQGILLILYLRVQYGDELHATLYYGPRNIIIQINNVSATSD